MRIFQVLSPPPKPSSPPSSGEDARAGTAPDAPCPSGSRARSRSAHPTSRSRPSLPITGVLTPACPTLHALWQPTEPVWSNLKQSLANLVKQDINQLTALVKTRLQRMQHRSGLLEGFLAKTRLDLTPLQ